MKVRFNGNRMSMPLPAKRGRIRRLLDEEQFDILHVQMPYSPLLAQKIILAAPSRTAVIGTFHIAPNSTMVRWANQALGIWTRRSLARFSRIVSVSSAASAFARDTFGLTTEVLPNAVQIQQFRSAEPFVADGHPIIVFLGRLVPRKGCLHLLRAAALLHEQDRSFDARVVVCGRGPLEPELKEFVRKQGIEHLVEFVGFVSEADKARYLKSADIAVFPSTGGESFGIVLIEAMAASRPVVLGADNAGYRSVLAPLSGHLFPVGDVQILAERIKMLLGNPVERQHAVAAQDRHVEQFDVENVGNRLLKIYTDALRMKADVQ